MRKPNEVWITTVVLERMLARGATTSPTRVIKGPDPEARIVNAHMESAADVITLVYDRPVDEPVLQEIEELPFRVSWSEEMLRDVDLDIRDMVVGLHTTEMS